MKTSFFACAAMALSCVLVAPSPAAACGGCFTAAPERTVVTDHRMAISVSTQQTVLWDQIRYSGDPAEFAWVLPVRSGAVVELSNDELFSALDAATQPVVYPPPVYGGTMGCGLAGCGMSSTSASSLEGTPGAGQVQILSQSVVGPYETVTLRATDPGALRDWLKSHAFQIPDAIGPIIDAYVAESFDFLALRLRPGCGERAMRPVRIVTPGADPTLPLRMVAAGVGARVGLTLYVLTEGRYQAGNFPNAEVSHEDVIWDRVQSRSNYDELTKELMAQNDGRTWVVEYADRPQVFSESDPRYVGGRAPGHVRTGALASGPGLADLYYGLCRNPGAITPALPPTASVDASSSFTPCPDPADGGADAAAPAEAGTDAGAEDAGTEDAGTEDAGTEDAGDTDGGGEDAGAEDAGAGEPDAAGQTPPGTPTSTDSTGLCLHLDDLDVALRGLHPRSVWVTRLRASLPVNALDGDLVLEPTVAQVPVSNLYYTTQYADEVRSRNDGSCVSAPKRRTAFGSWVLALGTGVVAIAAYRRRRRPRP